MPNVNHEIVPFPHVLLSSSGIHSKQEIWGQRFNTVTKHSITQRTLLVVKSSSSWPRPKFFLPTRQAASHLTH